MCFRNKGRGIGSGRDFISGCFRNSAGKAYRSRYTYFSNLVARMSILIDVIDTVTYNLANILAW